MTAPADVREAIVYANESVAILRGTVRGADRWARAWMVCAAAHRREGNEADAERCTAFALKLLAISVSPLSITRAPAVSS